MQVELPPPAALITGVAFAAGLLVVVFSGPLSRIWADRTEQPRVKRAEAERSQTERRLGAVEIAQLCGTAGGGLIGWLATELLGMALLLGGLGALLPAFMAAPRRRRCQMRVALAWSLWSRQIAELVRSGSVLAESLRTSVEHAPSELVPIVDRVAATAELHGFEAAMDELAASGSIWEPEIAAGLRVAYSSGGAIVDPLFELCGRIGDAVDLHRTKNQGVVQLWTQTIVLLALAAGVVVLMYANNPGYFEPYRTGTGQLVFVLIALLLLGSISFLVYHSLVREDHSFLVPPKRRNRAKEPI